MDESPDSVTLSKEQERQNFMHYRDVVNCLGANVPIECLCLPSKIEKALLAEGFRLVYDLLYRDFREVKGIGRISFDLIASRLDEFGTVRI